MTSKFDQIQLHYEFAMSIGTSLEMDTMLKKSLSTILGKMNCLAGGVHFLSSTPGGLIFEPVLSIPHKTDHIKAYGAALKDISSLVSSLSSKEGLSRPDALGKLLPACGQSDDIYYSILTLPGFGIVVLLNKEKPDPLFLRSLDPIFNKLAVACNACLQNEELIYHQQNLQNLVAEQTSELVSKNKLLTTEIENRKEYEEALGKSEEKYRELVENANSIILRWDKEGRITFFNEFAQTFFGFSEEEIIGEHVVGTIVPDTESTGRDLGPLMDDICKNPHKYEYNVNENIRRDGSRVWVAWTNKVLTDQKGRLVGAMSIGADITGHRAAEQRFKLAAEAISDLVYEWDMQDDSLSWFGDIDSALGFAKGEFPHTLKAWIDRIHPGDIAKLSDAVAHHRTSTEPINYEYQIQQKDGSWVYWSDYGVPVLDDTGKPSKWIGACTDITEKKRAEKQLIESEERYRALFTNEIDAISIFEAETGRIVDVNDSWVKLYGYERDEIAGMTVRDVSAEPDATEKAVKQSAQTGSVLIPERHHRKKDGTEFIVELAAGPFTWKGKRLMYALVRDITERKRMENELRASENQMKLITDNTPAHIAYVGANDLRYKFVNKRYEEFYKIPREEIIGRHIKDLISEQNYRFALPYIEKLRTGQPVSYENVFPGADGKRWIQVNYVPDFDREGMVQGIVVLSHDITDLKKTQEKHQRSEELLAETQKLAQLGSWEFDAVTEELVWSEETFRIAGKQPKEKLTLREYLDSVHPEDLPLLQETLETAAQDGKPYEVELRHFRPDGTCNYTLTRGKPVFEGNKVVKFIGSVLDITKQKVAEQEIQRTNEYLENVLEDSPDAIGIVDKNGKFVKWNSTAAQLYGFSFEELADRSFTDFYPDKSKLAEMLQTLHEDGFVRKYEIEMLRKDGTAIPFEISISLLKDENSNTIGSICMARDLSETKKTLTELTKAYDELQIAKKAAEAANKAKSTFLANMSHELRTPLNAILGFSQLMKRDPAVSAEQFKNLDTIGRSGEHLLALINDVLEFSKIEAGQMEVNEDNFDLHRLLLGLEEMFRLRAQQKGLSLDLSMTEDVPQFICSDQNKLRQILINLLGNAIKYTSVGGITLSVSGNPLINDHSDKRMLNFEVVDTGVGIDKKVQEKIFDAFFQTSDQRASRQGTGLGLPISERFVELMGGILKVRSEVGKGSRFIFSIPVRFVDRADQEVTGIFRNVVGLESGQQPFRLMVVEDNESSRNLLTTLLRSVGFEVEEAVNGQEALEKWREYHPHLIWMDMRMPVMDGYEAIAKIKSEMKETTPDTDTKIIALTASAFEEDRIKVMEYGGDDFVRKPFRESDLFDIMQNHLGVRYVYGAEDTMYQSSPGRQINTAGLKSHLESLPQSLSERLVTAIELSDMETIHQLIDEIRKDNSELASILDGLAENFAYDQILRSFKKH